MNSYVILKIFSPEPSNILTNLVLIPLSCQNRQEHVQYLLILVRLVRALHDQLKRKYNMARD